MTNERMTVSRPEDILGYIPHVLGIRPEESLVAMTMQGKALGATLRVDLPVDLAPRRLAAYAERVSDYLTTDETADGVLLAVYAAAGWEDGSVAERYAPLLAHLEGAFEADGLELRDAWLVGPEHWRGAFCDDPACCPWPGHPVERIRDSRLNAEMVFRGSSVADAVPPGDAGRFAGMSEPGLQEEEETAKDSLDGHWRDKAALDRMLDAWFAVLDRPGATGRKRAVDAGSGAAVGKQAAGWLRASLCIPAWRDAVAVGAAAGKETACAGAEAFGFFRKGQGKQLPLPAELEALLGDGNAGDRQDRMPAKPRRSAASVLQASVLKYGDVLLGLHPAVPDWTRLNALDALLEDLAARGGGEARAAALTIRGWIHWCRGSGSMADALLSQADAEQPGYRLAALLTELVHRGTLNGWVKNRDAAWRRFGGAAA
ncbi:hypothetical protein BIU82_16140 [Arthrobacter sp. SW1]|uniref:DUF4192 domain-containing protein n=1 Tax=Arthrobacter sp. SW1 TaxID=1920889 RepID=UPI000877BC9A|nr:DUF4192 domain-containing protein [Arthrobacter sp. SW1]OFI38984.1 hypothetical protein BIU82_16140 [Arthrobacter sp. SW1]